MTHSIAGVDVRDLASSADARGSLTEVLRSDWPEFPGFGQAIVTVNGPGVVRGWHWHDRQTDVIVVVRGRVLLPLYDGRGSSPTRGATWHRVAEGLSFALFVPPGVYHGYKTIGAEPAVILNFPSEVYDAARPDEHRIEHDHPSTGFDWDAAR